MSTWRHSNPRSAEDCDTLVLRMPAVPQYRAVLVLTARELAGRCGLDAHQTDELGCAVGEAFDNATSHAYRRARDGAVEIRFHASPTCLVVDVVDRGEGFPYRLLIQGRDDEQTAGDCGLRRMQQLVDEVSIRPNLPRGTVVTLVKHAS